MLIGCKGGTSNFLICHYLQYISTLLAVDCGRLSAPVNGTVHGKENTYPNILQFTCDEGFTLYGATRRNCQSNGTWSGSETICQGVKLYL